MSPILSTSLIQHVSTVPDPRIERTKRHQFLDIIGLAICGVICGAEGDGVGRIGACEGVLVAAIFRVSQWHSLA